LFEGKADGDSIKLDLRQLEIQAYDMSLTIAFPRGLSDNARSPPLKEFAMSSQFAPSLTIEQLAMCREKTETASKILDSHLKSYLDTIKSLFAPRRVLGRHVATREDVNISDRMLDQLKQQYGQVVSQAPFGLPIDFPEQTLAHLDNLPMVYAWEYHHVAKAGTAEKVLTITSPVRWVLTYETGAAPALVRQMLNGKVERRIEALKQFVVNALSMGLLIQAYPGVGQLLSALRYRLQTESLPGFGRLPFVTVQACLESFRPSDELLLMATAFSGVPAFVELIRADSLQGSIDPVTEQLQRILG
jgi:hypothetical protein